MTPNANEPAFASPGTPMPNDQFIYGSVGLTKRELLAAMAMQGLLANQFGDKAAPALARYSTMYADALLAELEKIK